MTLADKLEQREKEYQEKKENRKRKIQEVKKEILLFEVERKRRWAELEKEKETGEQEIQNKYQKYPKLYIVAILAHLNTISEKVQKLILELEEKARRLKKKTDAIQDFYPE